MAHPFHSSGTSFLSTPSARRATYKIGVAYGNVVISIHALREEGDTAFLMSSRGVPKFLSTPSARRATDGERPRIYRQPISIHALREEGDHKNSHFLALSLLFLSTPSARRATKWGQKWGQRIKISIHALREEGDTTLEKINQYVEDFYPRPPRGGRRAPERGLAPPFIFLSTPSARRATTSSPL